MGLLMKRFSFFYHVYFRHFLLKIYVLYLRSRGIGIDKSCLVSLKSKFDMRNPTGVTVGAGTYVAYGASILSHDFIHNKHVTTRIGRKCFVGANAIVCPGVTLGDSVIVGAGAVVTKSFGSNVIVAGNPAVIIKRDILTNDYGIISE